MRDIIMPDEVEDRIGGWLPRTSVVEALAMPVILSGETEEGMADWFDCPLSHVELAVRSLRCWLTRAQGAWLYMR